MYLAECVMLICKTQPNWTQEQRKVFLWDMTGLALHSLYIAHRQKLSGKSDVSSSLRILTMLMKLLKCCLILLNQGEPEIPTHRNEDVNVRRYSARDRVRPKYLNDYVTREDIDEAIDDTANCTIHFCYRLANVPQSYQDAISSPEASKWRDAMSDELNALWDNETYELTPLPEGQISVGGKWVYAVKLSPNGEEKHKARFVANGYSQVPCTDYHETF